MSDYPINLLEIVTSDSELRENIRRFHRDIDDNPKRSLSLVRQTKYWTYDPKSNFFGPGKFIGYKRMNFERYEYPRANFTDGDDFDGTTTREAIEEIAGEFFESSRLNDELYAWMEAKFGDAVANITRSKWRFVELAAGTRCWAACFDPREFDIETAVKTDAVIRWGTYGKPLNYGDRVVLWKTLGDSSQRGIVGLGEICARPPELVPLPSEMYVTDGQHRVPPLPTWIRVLPTSNVPLWISQHGAFLTSLNVARAGGRWFDVSESQWRKIAELAGLAGFVPSEEHAGGGQRYCVSQEVRDAIEDRSMKVAEDHFIRLGYEVSDVSGDGPYDLHCVRGDEVLLVEVKGMTDTGNRIFLTRNEVKLSQKNPAAMALAVVRNIKLNRTGDVVTGEGGDIEVRQPWNVDDCELVPTEYECFLPPSAR